MRDYALTLFVLAILPCILRWPWVGILGWTWVSLMVPGELTWSFARDLPFAQWVGGATLLAIVLSKEPKRIPWNTMTKVWLAFWIWLSVTTVFALYPGQAMVGWEKSMKIQLFSFIALMLINSPKRLQWFIVVIVLSLGFYGVKGGIFTIAHGGNYIVWGPGGFIGGNNELAFALIVMLPLMRYLQMQATSRWLSIALGVAMLLCAASIVGSHSRGAFLAIIAMGGFLVWKTRNRGLLVAALLLVVPLGVAMLPQHYWERMDTITEYEEDASATGRIQAWTVAFNLAKDRPLVGGGFNPFTPSVFARYSPVNATPRDVHSIYFEILGEQGFVGLGLFLLLALLAYRSAGWTIARSRGDPEVVWQHDLARMTQVCLVGYATGGAFLGLAYFDLLYNIYIIIVMNRVLLEQRLASRVAPPDAAAGAVRPWLGPAHRADPRHLPGHAGGRRP